MKTLIGVVLVAFLVAVARGQSPPPAAPARPDAKAATQPALADKRNAGAAVTSQPSRDLREALNTRVPEVHFDHAPFEQVIDWVQEYTGAIVYVRWAVLEDAGILRDTPITVKARDRKLSQILWVIMNEAAGSSRVTLAYQASEDVLLLSTHKDLGGPMVTRVYELPDSAVDVPKVPTLSEGGGFALGFKKVERTRVNRVGSAPQQSLGGGDIGGPRGPSAEITAEDERLHEFMELILCTVEPDSWEINGGEGQIFPYKGRLVVRNSAYVHQLIDSSYGAHPTQP